MTSLSAERRAELVRATEGALTPFLEDMQYLREVTARIETSRGELRRLSAVLRRLLVESEIASIANPRIGRIMLLAPDNKLFYKIGEATRILYFSNSAAYVFGLANPSILMCNLGPAETNRDEQIRRHIGDLETLTKHETISLRPGNFLAQRVICYNGLWVSRGAVISYVAWCSLGRAADPGAVVTALDALASDQLTREDRQTAAASIKEYCSIYASAIPTLSPAENAWLDQEIQEGRAISAMGSIEFFKKEAGERARYCVDWADVLLDRLSRTQQQAVGADEAWLWAQIASNVFDDAIRDYVPRLADRGSVRFNKDEVDASHLSPTLGMAILNRVLIPYLEP